MFIEILVEYWNAGQLYSWEPKFIDGIAYWMIVVDNTISWITY